MRYGVLQLIDRAAYFSGAASPARQEPPHVTRRYLLRPLILRALIDHRSRRHRAGLTSRATRGGLTLVEMLVAMAITLLIMGAVVTVFANISGSVTRRRATIEMSSALRNVRETLARDLAGATCPAIPWQRPESNHGYLEIIEGPQNDYYPSPWLWDGDGDGRPDGIGTQDGIDLSVSSLPGSNLEARPLDDDVEGRGLAVGSNVELPAEIATDGRGLGDADDILMLTVRNEKQPFVGRIPLRENGNTPSNSAFTAWAFESVESDLAEVVWFAVENPVDPQRTFAFGEPGYRTIHRRALLILPELDYGISVTAAGNTVAAAPGTVRVLPDGVERNEVAQALAGLIAFQDLYDLSVRLEWDETLPSNTSPTGLGRWVLRANSLGDLTKRENRYEHHGFVYQPQSVWYRHGAASSQPDRFFPFHGATGGVHTPGTYGVGFVADAEQQAAITAATGFQAFVPAGASFVVSVQTQNNSNAGQYLNRPFAFVNDGVDTPATLRAILNEDGQVVHVTTGLAPLGGSRRGDDIMMTDALAFDLRVYDPGAPIYSYYPDGDTSEPPEQIVAPGDPSWALAYVNDVADGGLIGSRVGPFFYERQGAYVDLAYGRSFIDPTNDLSRILTRFNRASLPDFWEQASVAGYVTADYFDDGLMRVSIGPTNVPPLGPNALGQRYATYDTWSWHYENNGVNEDGDRPDGGVRVPANAPEVSLTDEAVNGLDDAARYHDDLNNDGFRGADEHTLAIRFGPDDYAERETRPPYDSALRGMQVTLRAYERDSRQIREVNIRESFVPE